MTRQGLKSAGTFYPDISEVQTPNAIQSQPQKKILMRIVKRDVESYVGTNNGF